MKRILALTLTLIMVLAALTGCNASQTDNNSQNSEISQNKLLKEGNVKSISVTSEPNGYEYLFSGDDVKAVVDYLSNLHLVADFKENPNEYTGMTLVVSLEYDDGVSSTIYHFGNMFIRADDGPWYQMTYEEASRFHTLLQELSSSAVSDNKDLHIGTSDEEYKKIQFFRQPILEFTEESYDLTEFESSLLSDDDMELLRQIYNDGKGWTNDSVVDRTAFYFDGRIRFATEGSAGWMYFGFDQNVLYYNGMFTSMNEKVRDMLDSERISSQGEKEESSSDNSLTKSSVIYFSGENKTSALSALLLLNQVIMSNKRNARRIYTQ